LLTYSRSKGLFAGIDLTGTSVTQSTDDTTAFYGEAHSFEDILKGNVPVPDDAKPFVRAIAKYFHSVQK
jgi:lipid-binding SYLF domain-containing protein